MTVPVNPAVLRKYNVGPVKPWVQSAADVLGSMFNVGTIGGWRASDPFPDHPSGHALDFMMGIPQGNALANYAIANYKALGIKYIIHNHQVWNPAQGWHPYTSTSNPHTDHVHITFNDTPGTGIGNLSTLLAATGGSGGLTGLQIQNTPAPPTCAWNFAAPSVKADIPFLPDVTVGGQSFCILSKVQVRLMFSILVTGVGVSIGMVGVVVLVAYGLKASGIGSAAVEAASVMPGTGKAAKLAASSVR